MEKIINIYYKQKEKKNILKIKKIIHVQKSIIFNNLYFYKIILK